MVEIFEEYYQGLPVLHVAPSKDRGKPLPTIFFYHRYTASKELDSYFDYMLAKAGFRVIMPEADMHGSRFNGDIETRRFAFWDILKINIDELLILKQHYEHRGLVLDGRIGIGGTSMGGLVALGAMAKYSWIKAAADYMESGYFYDAAKRVHPPIIIGNAEDEQTFERCIQPIIPYDISYQLEKLANRSLFVWHGQLDDIVSIDDSRRLQAELANIGGDRELTMLIDPAAGHKITEAAANSGVEFFIKNL